jgi:hypothetical protein
MLETCHFYRLVCKKFLTNQFVRNLCPFYLRCGQCHKKKKKSKLTILSIENEMSVKLEYKKL